MHHPVEVVYKIYSIEEVVEDRYRVEEVVHRSHPQNGATKVVEEVVNHQIEAEEVEVVVGHVVLANNVNDDEMMRIIIQIT